MKLIDNTPAIVVQGKREIERELAAPADAPCVALVMLARRGRREIADALKGMATS